VRHVLEQPMRSKHYNFEMEVLTRALWAGLSVQTVPIRVWYPSAADRVTSFHKVRDNVRISRVHVRLIARRLWPVPTPRLVEAKEAGT
jgi:hypothetical protein